MSPNLNATAPKAMGRSTKEREMKTRSKWRATARSAAMAWIITSLLASSAWAKIVGPKVSDCDIRLAWPGDAVLTAGANKADPASQDDLMVHLLGNFTHVGLKSRHGVILEQTSPGIKKSGICPAYLPGGARASTYDTFLTGSFNPRYHSAFIQEAIMGTSRNHRVAHIYGVDSDGARITPQQRRRAEGYGWMQIGEWPYHDTLGHPTNGAPGTTWDFGGNYNVSYFNINLPWMTQYCSGLLYWAWNMGSKATNDQDPVERSFNPYSSDPSAPRLKGNDLGWEFREHVNLARHVSWELWNHPDAGLSHLCDIDGDADSSGKSINDVAAWIMGASFGHLTGRGFYHSETFKRGGQELIGGPLNQAFNDFFRDLQDTSMTRAALIDRWNTPQGCGSSGVPCQRDMRHIKGFTPSDLLNLRSEYRFGAQTLVEDHSAVIFEQQALLEQQSLSAKHRRDTLHSFQLFDTTNPQVCDYSLSPFKDYTDMALPYGYSTLRDHKNSLQVIWLDHLGRFGALGREYNREQFTLKTDTYTDATQLIQGWQWESGRYADQDYQLYEIKLPYEANHITGVRVHYSADIELGPQGQCSYDVARLSVGGITKEICGTTNSGVLDFDLKHERTGSQRSANVQSMFLEFQSDHSVTKRGLLIDHIEVRVQDRREDLQIADALMSADPSWGDDGLCHRCHNGPGRAVVNDGFCDPCLVYCDLGERAPGEPAHTPADKPQDGDDCLPPSKRGSATASIADELSHIAHRIAKAQPGGIKDWLQRYGDGVCNPELLIIMGDDLGDCSRMVGLDQPSFSWPFFRRSDGPF